MNRCERREEFIEERRIERTPEWSRLSAFTKNLGCFLEERLILKFMVRHVGEPGAELPWTRNYYYRGARSGGTTI
jgi:hypothetical protein